ncbi:MAG: O-antigen ligase family protein [Bdellovibrionales bacterium]|nr:O-antigen ligase family protein [Bdellovibrionales bacterium]
MITTSSYGFLQFLTGVDLIGLHSKTGGSMGDGTWRPTGFFSMSLTYAYCIGASAFICTFAALKLKNKTWFYVSAIFGVLGVLVAASRGAWIGILLTLFLYFLFAQRRLIIPFFILSGISFGALVMKSESAYRRISELLHGQLDESSQIRYHLWQAYTKMIAEHPFLGVGLFQTEQFLPEYYKKINIQESFVSHAHNIYLQWAAGAGLPALILFLFIAGYFLIKSFQLTKTSPWGWALFLAQVYLLIGGLTEANFIDAEVNHIWIFSWALTQFFSVTQPLAHAKSA